MKRIIVTPAGRKRYLEILYNNLSKLKHEFDVWTLWVNTTNQSDIDYMVQLEKQCNWIKLQYSKIPHSGNMSIYHFFKDCVDEDAIYIRLDDDIVYIHPKSLTDLFHFRATNPEPFLVYGNIINNAIISHIQQRFGNFFQDPKIGYACMDHVGWNTPIVAEMVHRDFLAALEKSKAEKFYMPNWILRDYERCSINVISWLGKEFKKFNGEVGGDEEQWLSCDKPKEIKKPNIIFGNCIFSHYSYFTQREHVDKTNILSKYLEISKRDVFENQSRSDKEDIISEILKTKLFVDNRGNIYHPDYESHLSINSGCWQFPDELADLMMFLKNKNINNFLNIGTFNAATFNLLADFLNKNKSVECITIDPINHNPAIKAKYKYLSSTSEDFKNLAFDLVFIDGAHDYNSVKLDYENVGKYAKICIFHDICDELIANEPSLNGGVPKFWNEIKQSKNCIEFNSPKKIKKIMGIGVLINQEC